MKSSFYLVLPNIRSAHNVGAMFRTADAFGVDKLYLVGYTATPPKPQIDKVALGAEQWIPWEGRKDLRRLIRSLQKKGVHVVALEKSEISHEIGSWKKEIGNAQKKDMEGVALIVGNEVTGVPEEIQKLCDGVVHIPMYGKKESLNVSVAAGVAMHVISEFLREG